jgi:hypothetical protein
VGHGRRAWALLNRDAQVRRWLRPPALSSRDPGTTQTIRGDVKGLYACNLQSVFAESSRGLVSCKDALEPTAYNLLIRTRRVVSAAND